VTAPGKIRRRSPFCLADAGKESRIETSGPQISLSSEAAVTLHMAFRELATNAA
jgi:two-component sensor histidine kinase